MSDQPGPAATPEHARLKEAAGEWKVDCTFYMDPSQPPLKVAATETVTLLGELWTTSRFEADMMGSPFTGCATIGYEPAQGRWVSTWIDTMTPFLFHFTGSYDSAGRVLTMGGEGPSPATSELTRYRTVEERLDPDRRRFEMFVEMPDGSEVKMFTHEYTRAR